MRNVIVLPLFWACKPTVGITEKVEVPTIEEAIGAQPSGEPSQPSGEPTSEPSGEPSSEPSTQPSSEPSQPSSEPTSEPSGEPSSEPSQPANEPTSEPSNTEDPCSNPSLEVWLAEMPYTVGCSWGSGGNLNPQQAKYRARTEQEDVYNPPAGYQICDILFDFESDAGNGLSGVWGYDDDFIFSLNDRVLVSSQAVMMSWLTPVSNTYEYKWQDIKNEDQEFSVEYFWIGSGSSFEAPEPEYPNFGASYMYIGSNALDPHRNLAISENQIRLQMTTFGDNDDGDCFNNGFYATAQVYIAPQ
ncbi:MAG: hypothetical protein CL916_03290 [Deltaproteobacteria bacterium]|nr:hypothetical protein [Deltaproteobacteria bacterium]